MTIGVYAVHNKINGRAYIGSSKHVELRLIHHKSYINTGLFLHYQGYTEDAKKYGVDAFEFKLLAETPTIAEARDMEQAFLGIFLEDLYNKAPSANGASGTKRQSKPYIEGAAKRLSDPEFRAKLSESCKGKREVVQCPHCGLQGGGGNMRRYHFDKCGKKS